MSEGEQTPPVAASMLEGLDKECARIEEIGERLLSSKYFLAALTDKDPDDWVSVSLREYGLLQLALLTVIVDVFKRFKDTHDTMHMGLLLIEKLKEEDPTRN